MRRDDRTLGDGGRRRGGGRPTRFRPSSTDPRRATRSRPTITSARESAIGGHLPSGMSMVRARPRWFTNPLYRADELDALGLVPYGQGQEATVDAAVVSCGPFRTSSVHRGGPARSDGDPGRPWVSRFQAVAQSPGDLGRSRSVKLGSQRSAFIYTDVVAVTPRAGGGVDRTGRSSHTGAGVDTGAPVT